MEDSCVVGKFIYSGLQWTTGPLHPLIAVPPSQGAEVGAAQLRLPGPLIIAEAIAERENGDTIVCRLYFAVLKAVGTYVDM